MHLQNSRKRWKSSILAVDSFFQQIHDEEFYLFKEDDMTFFFNMYLVTIGSRSGTFLERKMDWLLSAVSDRFPDAIGNIGSIIYSKNFHTRSRLEYLLNALDDKTTHVAAIGGLFGYRCFDGYPCFVRATKVVHVVASGVFFSKPSTFTLFKYCCSDEEIRGNGHKIEADVDTIRRSLEGKFGIHRVGYQITSKKPTHAHLTDRWTNKPILNENATLRGK